MRIRCLAAMGAIAAMLYGGVALAQQREEDEKTCAGFGFKAGTDAFANCLMRTSQQRDADEAAALKAMRERNEAEARQRKEQREKWAKDDYARCLKQAAGHKGWGCTPP